MTAPLSISTGTATITVGAGAGRLEVSSISNASGGPPTLQKTGAGELFMKGGFTSTGSSQPTTFQLQAGTVTLATTSAVGGSGNRNYTAALLRLEGGALRAVSSGSTPPQYAAYYTASVYPDTILSGSVAFGDPTGTANTRLGFSNGFRLEQDSLITVHNETVLSQHPQGAHSLTVGGTGRLVFANTGTAVANRLVGLVVDGGNVGVYSGSAALPVAGLTLTNGGRLDALRPFAFAPAQQIAVVGQGALRSAGPYSDMTVGSGNLTGAGTLKVEATLPPPPPNMPSAYYVQPGRIRITGTNMGFTGNTVVNGGELVIGSARALGGALVAGGTQNVTVDAGSLTVSGSGSMMTDLTLARVVINKGGTLKIAGGNAFSLTSQNVPVTPIAGMVALEYATISGSGVGLPMADGAIVQNAGMSSSMATLGCDLLYSGSAGGSVTLAGTFIPNRGFSWGGTLNVTGQLRTAGAPFDLRVSGAGVILQNAQNTFSGSTTITNGRLEVRHVNALGVGGRTVLISEGSQLDLAAAFTAGSLPSILPASAGMIGVSSVVSNTTVQTMSRGGNSLGPAYASDYSYSLSSLPAESGVYRFGSVTAPTGNMGFQMPRSFTITGSNVLTGPAAVVVGAVKGKALGSGGSTLTLNANQDFIGGVTVLPDFFLASERRLSQPFGTGTAVIRGKLLATGSLGSFASLATPVLFAAGGELWLDNTRGVNNDRWGDASSIAITDGAIRVSGNTNQTLNVSETLGTLEYAGRGQVSLNKIVSGSGGLAVTFAALAPQAGSHATLEIVRAIGTEKIYVTQAPTLSGAANLVPGLIDVRNTAPVTWNATTGELTAATANVASLAAANASAYVSLTTATTAAASASMTALRTTSSINVSGSSTTLTIGDGAIAPLLVAGYADIRPRLIFNGAGLVFTGSGATARLWGAVDAPNGLVKMGGGSLILSNTTAVTGTAIGSQTLLVREGRLSGNGSKLWNVIVESAGTLAPGNSPDVTELGGLVLGAETAQEFELTALDQVSDKTVVANNVTLDGYIDIVDWEVNGLGTMEAGTYDLITWGGTLTDNGIQLRTMPEGFDGYLNVDTSSKTLQLVVVPEPASLALALIGGAGVVWRRRRQRNGASTAL